MYKFLFRWHLLILASILTLVSAWASADDLRHRVRTDQGTCPSTHRLQKQTASSVLRIRLLHCCCVDANIFLASMKNGHSIAEVPCIYEIPVVLSSLL